MLSSSQFYFTVARSGDLKSYHTRHILTRVQSSKFILSFVKKRLILHGIQKTQPAEQNLEDIH